MRLAVFAHALSEQGEKIQFSPEFEQALGSAVWPALRRYKSCRVIDTPSDPLGWYAWLFHREIPQSTWLHSLLPNSDKSFEQCFLATPYQGQVLRDSILVFQAICSEAQLSILAKLLTDFFKEDGISFAPVANYLLVRCSKALDVQPVAFSRIDGRTLPDTHAPGRDAGILARYSSEIEMLLASSDDVSDVSGVWFWSPGTPQALPAPKHCVASNDPYLMQWVSVNAQADVSIWDGRSVDEPMAVLGERPDMVIFSGLRSSIVLQRSLWPRWGNPLISKRSSTMQALSSMIEWKEG